MSNERQASNGEPSTSRHSGRLVAAALGVVGSVYLATVLTLHPSVFWSPDEGAKFIQLHSRLLSTAAPHRIAYGAVTADPHYTFYPGAMVYPRPLWPSGVRCHWPDTFPLIALPFYRLFGIWGLYVVPLAAGLLAAGLAAAIARRLEPNAAVPAVLLAGLGTPLFFLSVLFFEHTLACALGLGALLCGWGLARGPIARRLGYALAAGAALLALFALRSEALIFVVALALTGVLVLAAERPGTALCAGLCGLALRLHRKSQRDNQRHWGGGAGAKSEIRMSKSETNAKVPKPPAPKRAPRRDLWRHSGQGLC